MEVTFPRMHKTVCRRGKSRRWSGILLRNCMRLQENDTWLSTVKTWECALCSFHIAVQALRPGAMWHVCMQVTV